MNTTFERNQVIIGGVILVLVAGGLGYWLGRSSAPESQTASPLGQNLPVSPAPAAPAASPAGSSVTPPSVVSGKTSSGSNSVSVLDQSAGMMVKTGRVLLANDGWVVVHESTAGKAGRILGAAWAPKGDHASVNVELLRGTSAGAVYQVMLHGSDGDHSFDDKKDPALTGSSATASFKAN